MLRRFIKSVLRSLVVLVAVAAVGAVASAAPLRNVYFDHYDIKNGLSQNTVNCLLQDRQGFVWCGTKYGLNRFDGLDFKVINAEGEKKCSHVTALYEDGEGLLWVGTHQGACIYNPTDETLRWFTMTTPDGHTIDNQVLQITGNPAGNVVLTVDNDGVYSYDKSAMTLTALHNIKHPQAGMVNRIAYEPDGRVWIGTFGSGVFYSDDNFKTFKKFDVRDGEYGFDAAIVTEIATLGDKVYLATDDSGLWSIDIHNGKCSAVFLTDENGSVPYIRKFMFHGNTELWIGTESGIYVYDIRSHTLLHHLTHNYFDKYSISDNAIYSLMTDRDGGIWAGSYFGGVDYLNICQLQFDKYYCGNRGASLRGERVREMCADSAGIIYIGTEDNGLSVFDPSTGRFSELAGIGDTNIHGLCIDGSDLWVGTFANGLKIKDLNRGGVKTYRSESNCGLASDYVFSIIRTVHGEMFLATMSGLQRYDRDADRFESIDDLRHVFIYDIIEDAQGNMWAASYSNGLYLRRAGESRWQCFQNDPSDPESLPSNMVHGLYEDMRHNVWIMTQNGVCVSRGTSGRFDRRFMGVDRIGSLVYQVADDENGRYWITTSQGLYCLDSKNGSLRRFTTADGLPTNQFNYSSSLRTADGKLWFGTIEGLVEFEPLRFAFSAPQEVPFVSEFYLHGRLVRPADEGSPLSRSISMTDEINLSSNQNSFALKIVTLNFSSPGLQRIRYKLEGFDKEWLYSTLADAMLAYSNLDSGTYHLKVATYDEHDPDAGRMMELTINIAAPFYRSGLALALYFVMTAGIVWFALRRYRRNSRQRNQRDMEKYKQEKERESYDSKIRFFTNVAHEIRTPLTLIKAPLDCVFRSPSLKNDHEAIENLDVINLNVNRLLLLVNQLLDFRKMESGKFQIHKNKCDVKAVIEDIVPRFKPTIESSGKTLEVSLPETPVAAVVDSEALTKILSNLVTNAIKYGRSYIRMALTADADSFQFTIANDGVIVAPEKREEIFTLFSRLEKEENGSPGTGIGLAYARNLAQMHGGTLVMDASTEENIFTLAIPLGNSEEPVAEAAPDDLEHVLKRNEGRVNILLVDDNAEMLDFLEKKLIAHNYNVFKASDGQSALDLLANQYVEVIVSDVMMPVMDGFEFVRRLKSDVSYSHIPVILLTAKTRMEDKLSGLEFGADAYIEKPFAIEYLLANISTLLRNRERMRARLENMPLAKVAGNGLSKVDEDFLRRINEIIQANFSNPEYSMEDVIAAMGMSRTTFYRKIKGLLDLNPNDYIKMERLKRAAQLFNEGHTIVSEVCYMVGFSSPGYFTKCFQKQFGMSPKDYISRTDRKSAPNN